MKARDSPEKNKLTDNITSLFSKYTGKEKLLEEIDRLSSHKAELELELNIMQKRMDKGAESEKRAVAAKQAAEEALNATMVKVRTLEHELEQRKDASSQVPSHFVESMPRQKAKRFVDTISSLRATSSQLLTVYIPPGHTLSEDSYRGMSSEHLGPETLQLLQKIDSGTGCVIFSDPQYLVSELVIPPFPVEHASWQVGEAFHIAPFDRLLGRGVCALVVIAHAGESLVGYTQDMEHFDACEVVRSNVKSKHTKGGFSQRRFERLRDEEIVYHAEKATDAIEKMSGSSDISPEYVLLCGDHSLARSITEDIAEDIPRLYPSADPRIEKNDPDSLLDQILVMKRYKL